MSYIFYILFLFFTIPDHNHPCNSVKSKLCVNRGDAAIRIVNPVRPSYPKR